MSGPHLLLARLDYHARVEAKLGCCAYMEYIRKHQLEMSTIFDFAGLCAVLPISVCGNGRFDFLVATVPGFVCEAFGEDGQTVIDLVAWTIDRPDQVLSMFGRAGLLGAWEAMNPATYFMGGLLKLHRTPLEWLKADCRGSTVVTSHIAARMLLEAPGNIAADNHAHGREISSSAPKRSQPT